MLKYDKKIVVKIAGANQEPYMNENRGSTRDLYFKYVALEYRVFAIGECEFRLQ